MKSLVFTCLIMIWVTQWSFGQTTNGSISGSVMSSDYHPISSSTITLRKAHDSTIIQTHSSDTLGKFSFHDLKYGTYFVQTSAIGYVSTSSAVITITADSSNKLIDPLQMAFNSKSLKEVSIIAKKPFFEQKADRMVVNVDASPSSAGSTAMDILEKSPGITVDKDGKISLKGKQGVTVMIDNRPTYLSANDLANYLKSLPASALDQVEIMTNPSAKYDAAGNSGIINLKTKKNKTKGFNGSFTLTHTQGVYPKPSGSLNLNYRNGKFNVFVNAGYSHWEGFQELDINRQYFNSAPSGKVLNAIFTQQTKMKFTNPEANLKVGMDYYADKKTTVGVVFSGFRNQENDQSSSHIFLKDAANTVDSIVYSPSTTKGKWKNGSINLNFRRQFDSAGRELTADADYITYRSGNDQYFTNSTYTPDMVLKNQTVLTGNLPSNVNIYSFKSDYTQTLAKTIKFEMGVKTSYVQTDNNANYYNVVGSESNVDTTKTNHFLYHENVNAAYVNFNRQFKKWNVQAGLRLENTNYSGHQLGNAYTVVNNDSSFKRSYTDLFPTVYISYQANAKNSFAINYGRRIDRPAYQDLNPFLFFLDSYTYQAGNPYLQPQFTHNIELSHTYNNFLTTTLNYSNTSNFFSETFEQQGYATIVRNGNIGKYQNAGIAVSAQIPVRKWWTSVLYTNVNYNQFNGMLYGEYLDVSAFTFMVNLNNQFKFNKGWSGEVSGFYRSSGVEGQVLIHPMGQLSLAVSKQILKEKGTVKVGVRDLLYTQQVKGNIDFQQTEATFHNLRDSRQVSMTFTYRFGKPIKGTQPRHKAGGADNEQNRVKVGGNN